MYLRSILDGESDNPSESEATKSVSGSTTALIVSGYLRRSYEPVQVNIERVYTLPRDVHGNFQMFVQGFASDRMRPSVLQRYNLKGVSSDRS